MKMHVCILRIRNSIKESKVIETNAQDSAMIRASTPTNERHIQGCEEGGTAGALEEGPEKRRKTMASTVRE